MCYLCRKDEALSFLELMDGDGVEVKDNYLDIAERYAEKHRQKIEEEE